ncbi:hypothetical protein [Acinetobacter haemolyticus]|uniref:hypothetical protein n=1 Tax=Acinetobacter haemolyticus TaxID=29430 RepID=UPI0021CD9F92|nr:hypothetical protein [Acinetobacter haemolyticus]MCU4378856.1 hypothetical protein [Acinetobacter haemolyticus]
MPKVISIIPEIKSDDGRFHQTQGTQVLLDDGSCLEGITKITLVAEVGKPWKAILEVIPINQKQIDAVLDELQVAEHRVSPPKMP